MFFERSLQLISPVVVPHLEVRQACEVRQPIEACRAESKAVKAPCWLSEC